MLDDADLAPAPARAHAFAEAWATLTATGPTLTAGERHLVIDAARAAWAGSATPAPGAGVLGEAAHWLAVDAGGLREQAVADFEARGLDRWRYLECVGVVGRLANLDFYAGGLGAAAPDLPTPSPAPPTGDIVASASVASAWVPTSSPVIAPFVLDALPPEGESLRALHEPMYMPMKQMGDGRYRDELERPQIEYLAARVSYLNECFY